MSKHLPVDIRSNTGLYLVVLGQKRAVYFHQSLHYISKPASFTLPTGLYMFLIHVVYFRDAPGRLGMLSNVKGDWTSLPIYPTNSIPFCWIAENLQPKYPPSNPETFFYIQITCFADLRVPSEWNNEPAHGPGSSRRTACSLATFCSDHFSPWITV